MNGVNGAHGYFHKSREVAVYEEKEWFDPNIRNLVADGKLALPDRSLRCSGLISVNSFNTKFQNILPKPVQCVISSVW